jgi:U3 small nucleolar RNA-associated protein 15
MIEELLRRDGLTIALSGRNEETLEPIISFLTQHITNPRYSSMLIDVSNILLGNMSSLVLCTNRLLDLYSRVLGQSVAVDDMLRKFSKKIHEEITIQKQMFELIGTLDLLMTASTVRADEST